MTPRSAAAAATVTKTKAAVKTAGVAAGSPAKKGVRKAAAKRQQMPAKRPGRVAEETAAHRHPPVAYRLHALLHTMHAIEHREDQLCTLLTAIEREGAVSPVLGRELAALLEELPMQAFVADIEAARRALASSAGTASKRKGA